MAFPLTPEAALCSCFRILLQDLAPILRSKDLLRFWNIDLELQIFQKKIPMVQDLLNNAEERSQEIRVSSWMDDLRELSYDMENLVDEMNIERVRMEQQIAIRNQAGTSHHVANRYTFWDNIADYSPEKNTIKKRIKGALARLDEVLVEANDLELKPQIVGRSPMSSIASRFEEDVGASVDESDVYGRQKDKDIVIQELLSCSSNKNYSVISIAGMGGVGKTTLARLIFYDQRVNNFDVRSWACVSDAFDAKKVVKDLIEYATDKNVSNMAAAALRRRLEDMVKGKKILIVLDDVWEVKAWDSLKVSFTHCAEGSKILVTTRDKNVGNSISNKECYELKTLEDEDCWLLFKGVVFGEVVNEKLKKIGREIVKKCKGVPLAVKVIGSTLRFASDERWENALRNELWQLEDGASDEIFPALKLSYHYLPSPLKRCFGYLSLFPTDYKLEQDKVVRLWIAEGFIESRERRSWEDIGHEYYKELQRRCLIQEDEMMHDLIHSLACSVSGKFSHCIANGTNSCMQMGSVRHLSVIDGNMDIEALDENEHFRALFLFSGHFSEKVCHQRLLRVLYLARPTLDTSELPISIGRLKCLRYLHLYQSFDIEYLPDSICELQNLQTLDLQDCFRLRSLPNDIGDLQKLRYLRLQSTSFSVLPTSIVKLLDLLVLNLNYCRNLSRIPVDIGNLVSLRELHLSRAPISSLPDSICKLKKLRVLNLRYCNSFYNLPNDIGAIEDLMELNLCSTSISHLPKSIGNLHNLRNLDIVGCERLAQLPADICNLSSLENFKLDQNLIIRLPRGIGRLRNIKRLAEFVVGKEEGWGIEELNGMNKLKGSLTISHLENVDSVDKARMASLKSKIYIDHLYFEWSMDDASDVGGAGLTTRDGETEENVFEALEPYPTGLVTLFLNNYHGERVPMWMANLRFPSLVDLTMDGLWCVQRVMDVVLPSLKNLRIENCPKLRVVSMGLPNLEFLRISSCQDLTTLCMIPSLEGFSYAFEFSSLQTIQIINCPVLLPFLDKGLPPMLQELEIASCTTFRHLPEGLLHSTSLLRLTIKDCPELVSFPEEGIPPMLQDLSIRNCTSLRHLPTGLRDLTSLKTLKLFFCPELRIMTDDQLPPNIRPFISNCPKLEQQLKEEGMKDWRTKSFFKS